MTRIRAGRPEDVPAVLELLDDAVAWLVSLGRTDQWGTRPLSANPRRVALTEEQARDGELHLAVDGDLVVGVLGVGGATEYVPPAVEPELYVRLLVTRRAYAAKGVGSFLLDHARRLARERGVGLLRVDCFASEDRALVGYYERQGFTATDRFEVTLASGQVWQGQVLAQRLG
ncbi:GNAT family N-acetyltransferase [Paractinoplanes rishiriensis]|uniref:GCN5 family N-acetyltransferase n=1 Tax=Paractinoplanes rishiriensis TaxID=1050105 RepID=A0A919N0T9_9ACTN|nr:GNAT family N-acetyltransferase [Actinoplanes rishiriensis]GIF00056.1 GCN5 family N-acetyltransferase [Actinoplanes rishiriensis]